jgi:Lrp/AsnC family transcriptional regulator
MKLTKNEEKTLELMLNKPNIKNQEIADKLGLTSQAIGKIRSNLRKKGVLRGYDAILDYEKMGIRLFALSLVKIMPKAFKKYDKEEINKMIQPPNVIALFTVPQTTITHIIIYAFRGIAEYDNYFRALQEKLAGLMEIKESYVFSNKSFIKNSPKDLFLKILSEMKGEKRMPVPLKPKIKEK